MGGKGEPRDQKMRATQDQLRLARLTQDVPSVDDDRTNVHKLIKKVLETTRCSVSEAEIALYDTDNNVEEAVNLILEETYADENVWKEQKSRKTKRADAEKLAVHRSRNHSPCNSNNMNGSNRARGSERDRGGFGGGARGRGRGGFHQSTALPPTILWDNTQTRPDPNKEWTSTATNEVLEDSDWKAADTLVFSHRDDVTLPLRTSQQVLNTSSSGATSSNTTTGGISVAAAHKQQPKSHVANYCVSSTTMFCEPTVRSVPSEEQCSLPVPVTCSPKSVTVVATSTSADWTAQLKNDLGISTVKTNPPLSPLVKHKPIHPLKQKSVVRPLVHFLQQQQASVQLPHHAVEFVSGGDASAVPALPEYQFGFHVETGQESVQPPTPQPDVFSSSQVQTKPRISNRPVNLESELPTESALLSNGAVCEFSIPISSHQHQQQPEVSVKNSNGMGLVSTHTQVLQGRQGLSYADTSSMSYPSDNSRNVKPSLSSHQQQQAQHQLYTAAQMPYNSYQYLNMYSTVTGVRQNEPQYAAALVQYPFGVGQIDMSSLSTMLPPAALASQHAYQPPPPVQPQHQLRDQHASYLDPKTYAANSTAGADSASLLGTQQQRDSTAVSACTVTPPPGFSGPPSNMPTAAFTLPQPSHISSLFHMPPTYHPQLNQLPFSFMPPSVTNSQHKLNHQMYAQQPVDESLSDQRLSSQKVYGGHQQMDEYGNAQGSKIGLDTGAQATPPPQMYQPPQNYLSQQMPLHAYKKTYGNVQRLSHS